MPNTSYQENLKDVKNEITDLVKDYSLNKLIDLRASKAGMTKYKPKPSVIIDYGKSFRNEDWYKNLSPDQQENVELQIASHIHRIVYDYLDDIYKKANNKILEKEKKRVFSDLVSDFFRYVSNPLKLFKETDSENEENKRYLNRIKEFKKITGFFPGDPYDLSHVNCAAFATVIGEIYDIFGYKVGSVNVTGHVATGVRIKGKRYVSDVNFNELKSREDWEKEAKSINIISNISKISYSDRNPKASMHNNLGSLLKNLDRFEEAEKELRKSIKINPNNATSHYNLGNLSLKKLENLNKKKEAKEEYKETIKKEAEKELKEVIKINPTDIDAYSNLAKLFEDSGRYEDALKEYQKVARIDLNNTQVHYAIGNLLIKLGRKEEAGKEFKKSMGINPDEGVEPQEKEGIKKNYLSDEFARKSRPLIIILIFLGIIASLLVVLALLSHPLVDVFAILGSWLK